MSLFKIRYEVTPVAADPAASPFLYTRVGFLTRFLSVTWTLTTDANAANRTVSVVATTKAEGRLLGIWILNQTQAASLTRIKVMMLGLPVEQSQSSYQSGMIPEHWFPPETAMRVITGTGAQVGDVIGPVIWLFQEMPI